MTAATTTVDALSLRCAEFVDAAREHGLAAPAATTLYRTLFRTGRAAVSWIATPEAPVVRTQPDERAFKFVQRMHDGRETESVVLAQTGKATVRRALCVSSQIGCAMGCTFCETAQMGLLRNLTTSEIIAQWFAARFALGHPIDNVVFMGMGEPMENLAAVLPAIRVLADRNGAAVPASRITVSTVGRTAGIRALAAFMQEEGFGRLRLAVSVNAPNDAIRREIMPLNRAEPMVMLRRGMDDFARAGRRRILIEYVVIPGVNDAPEHAGELCRWLDGLPSTVNVIPYNPRRDSPWPAPTDASVDRFVAAVAATGQPVRRRRTLGRSAAAACGQLGNPASDRKPGTVAGLSIPERTNGVTVTK